MIRPDGYHMRVLNIDLARRQQPPLLSTKTGTNVQTTLLALQSELAEIITELSAEIRSAPKGSPQLFDYECELENANRVLAWLQTDLRAANGFLERKAA